MLAFGSGEQSESNTLLVTDFLAHTPPDVLAKNFGVPEATFRDIPLHDTGPDTPARRGRCAPAQGVARHRVGVSGCPQHIPQQPNPRRRNDDANIASVPSLAGGLLAACVALVSPQARAEASGEDHAESQQYQGENGSGKDKPVAVTFNYASDRNADVSGGQSGGLVYLGARACCSMPTSTISSACPTPLRM